MNPLDRYQDPLSAELKPRSYGADDLVGSPQARPQARNIYSPTPPNGPYGQYPPETKDNTGWGRATQWGKSTIRHPATPTAAIPGLEPGAYPKAKRVSKYEKY